MSQRKPKQQQMGCTFCLLLKRVYEPVWRDTREEAQADWNAHVLAEHNDLQWVEDNRASLAPLSTASREAISERTDQ